MKREKKKKRQEEKGIVIDNGEGEEGLWEKQ
jgi:hypothetical protein